MAHPAAQAAQPTWPRALADALIDGGIEVAAWVPDKRLAPIAARLAERGIPLRALTREEECFGYAAGYRAAGGMPLVMAQCSGLGNSFNATARAYDEVAGQVRTLDRPALLEVRYDERTWPGPSPFVDAPVVRWRFEQAASSP